MSPSETMHDLEVALARLEHDMAWTQHSPSVRTAVCRRCGGLVVALLVDSDVQVESSLTSTRCGAVDAG